MSESMIVELDLHTEVPVNAPGVYVRVDPWPYLGTWPDSDPGVVTLRVNRGADALRAAYREGDYVQLRAPGSAAVRAMVISREVRADANTGECTHIYELSDLGTSD